LENLTKIVFVLAVILLFPIIIHQAFAYTIEYEPIGYKLKQNPTICAIEPSDPNLSDKEIEKLFDQTRISVSEWEVKLQQAAIYQKYKDYWEIDYVQIEKGQTDAASNCDIKLYYYKKPEIPLFEHALLGLAELDPLSNTWDIKIYYSETKLEKKSDTRYYWYEPYYTDNLKTQQELGTTIRHEVGHALGLGHYTADDVSVSLAWSTGKSPAPSVMVPFQTEFSDEQKIVPKDIDKLRSIYGENGFTTFSDVDEFESFKALMFIEKDYFDKGLSYSEKYLKNNPSDEEILYFKGEALWGLDRYSDAEKIMDDVLGINPENEGALYTKAKALAKSKNYDESLEYLDNLLLINPEHDKALSYKGRIFEKQEMYIEAEEYYLEAFQVNPFNTSNLNRYTNLLSDFGFYEVAVLYYVISLLVEPDDVDTLYNIAYALDELERDEESQQYYEKAEQLESEEILIEPKETIPKTTPEITEKPQIPDWVRNNAEWWAQGAIGDNDFVSGIQYLIKEKIMHIPETAKAITPGRYFSIMVLRYNLSGPKGFLSFRRSFKIRIKISLSPLSFCISTMMDFMRSSFIRL